MALIGQISNTYTGPDNDDPDLGSIVIRLPDASVGPYTSKLGPQGFTLPHFLSYEYDEHYTTPTDGWHFEVSADSLSVDQRNALKPGLTVEVIINDQPQSVGILDKVRVHSSKGGGTVITLEGRDWFSSAVDSQADPGLVFTPNMSLLQMLEALFADFGFTIASADNIANRNVITGRTFGTPTSKKGKQIKSYLLHEEKPYPNEGAYHFASRVAARFGLAIRPGVTKGTIIVAAPDYDQPSRYTLHHKTDENSIYNNVLESDVSWDREAQPSVIFASGFGAGGDFAKSQLRAWTFNPLVATPTDTIQALVHKYYRNGQAPQAVPVPAAIFASGIASIPIPDPNARPLYLYDGESHTQEQLNAYLVRELSLKMRRALSARYTILGHRIGGLPVAVDTMIDVDDDRTPLHQPLWVFGRRFSKTAGGGTRTELELIRPGSLILGPSGNA